MSMMLVDPIILSETLSFLRHSAFLKFPSNSSVFRKNEKGVHLKWLLFAGFSNSFGMVFEWMQS